MPSDIIITGSRERPTPPEAAWWAMRLGAPIVPRGRSSLKELAERHGAWGVVAIQAHRVTFYVPGEDVEYFYHPGMARRRVRNVAKGMGDPMVTAMSLRAGDRVLDCTLGRGTDATIASLVVGDEGRVVGLESVPIVAAMTEHGLKTFDSGVVEVNQAMARIQVVCADNADYLSTAEPGSFDVVYFDPLFDRPIQASSAMVPLRALADARGLTRDVLDLARRVAQRWVVVKQRRDSPLWEELVPEDLVRGHHSSIEYGRFAPVPR